MAFACLRKHKVFEIFLGMEDQQDRALYEAMIRIKEISKRRPCEGNVLKKASRASGLNIVYLRKSLFSLVNAGTIQVAKTPQGNCSYFVSNIDDSEAISEL